MYKIAESVTQTLSLPTQLQTGLGSGHSCASPYIHASSQRLLLAPTHIPSGTKPYLPGKKNTCTPCFTCINTHMMSPTSCCVVALSELSCRINFIKASSNTRTIHVYERRATLLRNISLPDEFRELALCNILRPNGKFSQKNPGQLKQCNDAPPSSCHGRPLL